MSHRRCCCSHSHRHGNFLLPLASLIAIILLAFGRCRGTKFAILIVLAVFIVCGCGCFNRGERC